MQFCFDLVKNSLIHLYEPVWGWSDEKKKQQLSHNSSRFILAQPSPSHSSLTPLLPAAYINFRIEAYDGKPSLYLYEVMVAPSYQRMGLGSRMMQLVEEMAWSLGLDQLVLTEFVANKAANSFYKKLGFKTDASNPKSPSCGYVILSKKRPSN